MDGMNFRFLFSFLVSNFLILFFFWTSYKQADGQINNAYNSVSFRFGAVELDFVDVDPLVLLPLTAVPDDFDSVSAGPVFVPSPARHFPLLLLIFTAICLPLPAPYAPSLDDLSPLTGLDPAFDTLVLKLFVFSPVFPAPLSPMLLSAITASIRALLLFLTNPISNAVLGASPPLIILCTTLAPFTTSNVLAVNCCSTGGNTTPS